MKCDKNKHDDDDDCIIFRSLNQFVFPNFKMHYKYNVKNYQFNCFKSAVPNLLLVANEIFICKFLVRSVQ